MQTQPEAGNVQIVVRRRPTRRHLRNRLIRRFLILTSLAVLTFATASVALHYLSPSLFRASVEPDRQAREASRNFLLATQEETLRSMMQQRPVYPYSVVRGGVRDVHELKWATEHDPVVAAHYAGFDFDHARVVRLTLGRMVYVSYRIGSNIYWSRHPIALHKGETLITDGKMTGRTRCANRVEQSPQQGTSNLEPPVVAFDEPMAPAIGTATQTPPVPYQSSLLNQPPPGTPPESLVSYDPFGPGRWIPFYPPPLPGVCGVGEGKKNGTSTTTSGTSTGKKGKGGNACGPGAGGGEVPEPSTWVLVLSGMTLMYWSARRRFARN